MKVSPTRAAYLVHKSERTIRRRLADGSLPSTQLATREHEIETSDLEAIAGWRIDSRRLADVEQQSAQSAETLRALLDQALRRLDALSVRVQLLEASRSSSTIPAVPIAQPAALSAAVMTSAPRFSASRSPLADTFADRMSAAKWLVEHGIASAGTARRWFDDETPPFTKRQALQIALDVNRHNVTVRHAPHVLRHCDELTCVCHDMLDA